MDIKTAPAGIASALAATTKMAFQVAGEGTRGTIEPEVRQVDARARLSPRGRLPTRLRADCFCRWPDLT